MKRRKRTGRRRSVRKTLGVLGLLALLLAALVVWAAAKPSKRVFEPESAEMLAKRQSPENAFFALLEAAAALPEKPESLRVGDEVYEPVSGSLARLVHVGRPDDDPELSAYLEKTEAAVAGVRAALDNPHFLFPPAPDEDEWLKEYGTFWKLGRVMVARARWLAARGGDGREAMALIVDATRLGTMISGDGPARGIEFYTDEVLRTAADGAQRVARHCSDEVVCDAVRDFCAAAAHVESGRDRLLYRLRAFDEEPRMHTQYYDNPGNDWIVKVMNAKLSLGEKWTIHQVRRYMREHLDELLDLSDRPYLEFRQWEHRYGATSPGMAIVRSHLWRLAEARAKARARTAGAAVSCALELHRRARGACPESLDELELPEGLTLPPDPFSGESLVYRQAGEDYVLYSVGWDQTDDGGDFESRKDLALHFPGGEPPGQ